MLLNDVARQYSKFDKIGSNLAPLTRHSALHSPRPYYHYLLLDLCYLPRHQCALSLENLSPPWLSYTSGSKTASFSTCVVFLQVRRINVLNF